MAATVVEDASYADRLKNWWGEGFFTVLAAVLAGYSLFGRGFAYIGVPPIFIGEFVYALGLIALLLSGCFLAAFATAPAVLLAIMMTWVAIRTLPYVDQFGFDALRDSMIVMYGGFAVIVTALLHGRIGRVATQLRRYHAFTGIFVVLAPVLYAVSIAAIDQIPTWPHSGVPVINARPGEIAVHLAGVGVFVLVGFRRLSTLWTCLFLLTMFMVAATSRSGILAVLVPIALAALLTGRAEQLFMAVAAGLLVLTFAYLVEEGLGGYVEPSHSKGRMPSARQLVDNILSIFGQSGDQLEGTKRWRLEWWNLILNDTLFGQNFWTGLGFGVNLAIEYGFQDTDHPELPPLRSPHNSHLTMLARAGVPGLALWGLTMASWLVMMFRSMQHARRRGQEEWARRFLFVACYGIAFLINACFDVALEGPMQGIWFWSLFGFGVGATMVYRAGHGCDQDRTRGNRGGPWESPGAVKHAATDAGPSK